MMDRQRRRNRRGYTAVEVLSALTLLAIGGAGVIGMQRVTIQGSEDARRYDVGANIANEWLSRLQRDATQWTQPNATIDTLNNISNTKWLGLVVGGTCFPGWCSPPASIPPAGMTGSFDIFGRDQLASATDSTYCAQYRLQWIADPGVTAPFKMTGLIRAEVRVFWSRLERTAVGDCAAATASADLPSANQLFHFIYATTAIRENALRQ